jgi:hypothetical protein
MSTLGVVFFFGPQASASLRGVKRMAQFKFTSATQFLIYGTRSSRVFAWPNDYVVLTYGLRKHPELVFIGSLALLDVPSGREPNLFIYLCIYLFILRSFIISYSF